MKRLTPLYNIIYISSIICVLIVAAMRIGSNTGINIPLLITTSGCEEESMFAIWKFINGGDVYTDPHNIPYAASYFNWLFYYMYGSIIGLLQALFGFSDDWIAQIGRYITLLGTLFAAFISAKTILLISGKKTLSLFFISIITCYFLGFFTGFWMFTLRPDVWAMALAITGLYFFLLYINKSKLFYLVLSALIYYLAWSFKHNFAGLAIGCGAMLVLRKRFAHALLFAAIPVTLVPATYLLGSEAYRYLIVKSQLGQGFVLHIGLHNLKLAVIKSFNITATGLFIVLFVTARYGVGRTFKKLFGDDVALVLTLSGLCSFFLFFAAATKAGASDNYFFTAFSVFVLIIIYTIEKISTAQNRNIIYGAYNLFSVIYILLGVMVIMGKQGATDLSRMSDRYYGVKKVVVKEEQPLLVEKDNLCNLPWVNPADEHYILATTYPILRETPEKLEKGGVEGMMEEGRFKTVINIDNISPAHKEKYYLADTIAQEYGTVYVWKLKER